MLSTKIMRLRETFDAWSKGNPYPTEQAWLQFARELRDLQFEAAMLELGVDLSVIDVAVEMTKPHSNVVVLRPRPQLRGGTP